MPLHSHHIHRRGSWSGAAETVSLGYDARLLRRRRLVTDAGEEFLVDLAETTGIDDGDAFRLSDGRFVQVAAAPERLLAVTGGDLARFAWHIGNRHTPCQIEPDRLVIAEDHVLAAMLRGLGATVTEVTGPFRPEGGAYGHGRTMGHAHGPDDHGHDHGHDHHHDHDHHHHDHGGHGPRKHVHHHVVREAGDDPERHDRGD
ncbi:urease accessory protein UreE [Frigidibacter sp. MR17.24]|uniref:urease accessory protein UreE n=1 Tax=Frigidibacter sp. MR17.24 TaxID=3127345 RepID=UPI003012EA03